MAAEEKNAKVIINVVNMKNSNARLQDYQQNSVIFVYMIG